MKSTIEISFFTASHRRSFIWGFAWISDRSFFRTP